MTTAPAPEYRPVERDVRKVRMTVQLMAALCEMVAEIKSAKVTLDWGEPDSEGFYSPTIRVENV